MAFELVLSITNAMVTFGGRPLFEDLSFNIHQGDKICLIGKNGAGKSTLMRLIAGTQELDDGKRIQAPNITTGYLQQEVEGEKGQTVFDFVRSGLTEERMTDEYLYMVDMMMEPFELNPNDLMHSLSGGQVRRAALARSLVEDPDILLLDEPTNHLDLQGIEWLEQYLKNYRGTLLCVSHDKSFLANISNKIFWLDRGRVRVCPKGFAHFEEWSAMLIDQEKRELANREKILEGEIAWATQGVKARRKRNVRRVEQIKLARDKLKMDKSIFNKTMRKIELEPLSATESSNVIAEFFKVKKSFASPHGGEDKKILDSFNLRVMKGDRIGVLGKNGSGKTTFLKLLVGEMKPDMGSIKMAKNLQISYFDQKRQDLNQEETLWKTLCPGGGEFVDVRGKLRHVCGYLKDFLFDPKNANDIVGTLSGGQKNRLMLAKILANPGNLLILDEPTNDLDMDTLEMLEDILASYEGTMFIVSHDRDFLDQTVTKILAFEGNGEIEGSIGGYTDYLEAKQKDALQKLGDKIIPDKKPEPKKAAPVNDNENKKPKKLSYKYQFELENLPKRIATLEDEIEKLNDKLADPSFYEKDPDGFFEASRKLGDVQLELERRENRWLELEEMKVSS